jgi:hypothetical protein
MESTGDDASAGLQIPSSGPDDLFRASQTNGGTLCNRIIGLKKCFWRPAARKFPRFGMLTPRTIFFSPHVDQGLEAEVAGRGSGNIVIDASGDDDEESKTSTSSLDGSTCFCKNTEMLGDKRDKAATMAFCGAAIMLPYRHRPRQFNSFALSY